MTTKKDLEELVNQEVWIIPTGNNKPLKKSDEECLYSSKLLKVTSSNAYFDNSYTPKLKLDGSWDNNYSSGLIFTSKEKALNYIWKNAFAKKMKHEMNFDVLSYEDLKTIEQIFNKAAIINA